MSQFLNHVLEIMRKKHYSIHTEKAYADWIRHLILFHGKRHPSEMRETGIAQFLSHLATDRNVAADTRNQALNALVSLYAQVLKTDLGDFGHIEKAGTTGNLPTVMTKAEVALVLSQMSGVHQIQANLLYGCGSKIWISGRTR